MPFHVYILNLTYFFNTNYYTTNQKSYILLIYSKLAFGKELDNPMIIVCKVTSAPYIAVNVIRERHMLYYKQLTLASSTLLCCAIYIYNMLHTSLF